MPRLLLAAALALPLPALPAQGHPARPADVATPEAIVAAMYESIARAPGKNYDWDRNLSLFLPSAKLIANTEQRGGQFLVQSPAEFRDLVNQFTRIGGPNDRGFAEEQIAAVTERFGDVAHVFSTYQKHYWQDPNIIGRGINSIQMVWHQDRWWITSVIWDEEQGAGPLPARYLPGPR